MKKNVFFRVLLLAALSVIVSCSGGGGGGGGGISAAIPVVTGNAETPFIISKPQCNLGNLPPHYTHCGVHFTITNKSQKTMNSLSVSCMVYADMDGNNPFIGNNNVHADFPESIAPGQTKTLILNLDPYITVIPTEPFIIDFFFVKTINFSDGSVYTDYNGTHAVSSY